MEFNGTFFAAIISFLAFVFIMNKMLYLPVRKIVNERNDFINKNYEFANINNTKADELSADREAKIVIARDDAREKYNDILTEYKEQKTTIISNAQNQSHNEIEQALNDLNNISNATKEDLKDQIKDLANDIVEKVLGYRSEVQDFDLDKVNEILYQEES